SMTNSSASEILERIDAEIALIQQGKNINDGLIVLRNITKENFDNHDKILEIKENEIIVYKSIAYQNYQEAQFFRCCLYKDLMETIMWWYNILLDKVVDYVLNIKIVKKVIKEIKEKIPGWVLHIIQTQDVLKKFHPKNWFYVKYIFKSFVLPLLFIPIYLSRIPVTKASDEKMVIEVPGDDNVRKEIISYLRTGKIDYNYKIESNFFTSEKTKHNEIIGIWEDEYGDEDNKPKFRLMKVTSKKNHLKKQSVAGVECEKGNGKILKAFLLCYVEDGDDVNY
ncbi:13340_t:CDS:2, partial [Racocetra persica]